MARQRDPETTDMTTTDETPAETRADAKAPDDVLCYVDRLGALVCHWNEAPGASVGGVRVPVQHRCRLEPGLSFCPGGQWDHVRKTPGWTERAKLGALRAVAGQGGDLAAEWSKAKPAALVGMLAKTFHLPALERLRELEASLAKPRLEVAQEIDARLAEMGAKLGNRQQQRRGHRKARRGQVLG